MFLRDFWNNQNQKLLKRTVHPHPLFLLPAIPAFLSILILLPVHHRSGFGRHRLLSMKDNRSGTFCLWRDKRSASCSHHPGGRLYIIQNPIHSICEGPRTYRRMSSFVVVGLRGQKRKRKKE